MNKKNNSKKYAPYLDSKTKRYLDIFGSLILLIPALIIISTFAIIIIVTEGKPALFTQKRVAKNLKLFSMTKLRTLKTNAKPYMPSYNSDLNPYLIPFGKFLRAHRLDELPQLFSVIKGDMSLVGPRPELLQEIKKYKGPGKKRFQIKPGLTGLWQIKAPRNTSMHHNKKYDLFYLRKANMKMDLWILAKTAAFVLKKNDGNENRIYSHKISFYN